MDITDIRLEPGDGTGAEPFLRPGTLTGLQLPALLSARCCDRLGAELERRGFVPTGRAYPSDYRNNDRLVFDDPSLAAELWAIVAPRVPAWHDAQGARWIAVGLNLRFRACRYRGGQHFTIHRDGPHVASDELRSWMTLQIYVNDGSAFTGGRTRFYTDASGADACAAIAPRRGAAIVFDHRAWHDGEPVTAGTKIVLRTDVMYRRDALPACTTAAPVIGRHSGYVWRVLERADGRVASSGRDGTVRVWSRDATARKWSRDGTACTGGRAGGGDGVGGSGEEAGVFACTGSLSLGSGSITALVEDGDGRLWCGSRGGELVAWNGERGHAPSAVIQLGAAILDLAVLGDGSVVAALASGEVVGVESSGLRGRRRLQEGWMWGVTRAGAGAVTCGEDGVLAWMDADGAMTHRVQTGCAARAVAAGCILDRPVILAGGADGNVRAIGEDGAELLRVPAHRAACTALAVCGSRWLSGGEDSRVHLWDGPDRLASWTSGDFVRSVAFTSGGDVLFAGYEGAVELHRSPENRAPCGLERPAEKESQEY